MNTSLATSRPINIYLWFTLLCEFEAPLQIPCGCLWCSVSFVSNTAPAFVLHLSNPFTHVSRVHNLLMDLLLRPAEPMHSARTTAASLPISRNQPDPDHLSQSSFTRERYVLSRTGYFGASSHTHTHSSPHLVREAVRNTGMEVSKRFHRNMVVRCHC